jgi:phosphoribosylglycinamide formyltransferase 1
MQLRPDTDASTIDIAAGEPASAALQAPDARLVVMASGNGTNLQAIIDAHLNATIVLVVSDRPDAGALRRAERAGIVHQVCEMQPSEQRSEYDHRLAEIVAAADADWIVLAGWMRLLSNKFVARFPHQIINLHPALPGEYPGLHAIERAFADAKAGRRDYTGIMIHLVPDEGVDDGPVLAMTEVGINIDDTLELLTERVHAAEHELLVRTIAELPPQRHRPSLRPPANPEPAPDHSPPPQGATT